MRHLILIATIALGGLRPVIAQAMTNEDVVKMLKAGLDEDTISAAVRGTDAAEFDTSADGLIALKQAGVSESVIQEIVTRESGASSARGKIKYTKVDDAKVLPPPGAVVAGKEYYTRYTFMHEDGEHSATNYWRGALVPINTKVKLLKLKKNSFAFQLVESGEKIVVKNKSEYYEPHWPAGRQRDACRAADTDRSLRTGDGRRHSCRHAAPRHDEDASPPRARLPAEPRNALAERPSLEVLAEPIRNASAHVRRRRSRRRAGLKLRGGRHGSSACYTDTRARGLPHWVGIKFSGELVGRGGAFPPTWCATSTRS